MKPGEGHVWRFLNTGASDAGSNMATDEALARKPLALPTLRVYCWQPYTISIGYNQKVEDVDLQECRDDGIEVVRRPTGGRAIFHAHEVTYSVIIPRNSAWYRESSLELYNEISSALVLGLQCLGLPVQLQRVAGGEAAAFSDYRNRFACFATSAKYEIHCEGKKLVGSAQRRFDNSLLQHGSIILGREHLRLLNYLVDARNGAATVAKQQLEDRTVCVETLLNRKVDYGEVAEKIKLGFESHFKIKMKVDRLSDQEQNEILQLKPKYHQLRRNLP